MKRSAFSIIFAAAILALAPAVTGAAPVNATGEWHVQVSTPTGVSSGTLTLNQVGQTVLGRGTVALNSISGNMVSDTKMNGTWSGPKGAGWLTIYFTNDGNSFSGQWGYNGGKPAGNFVGQKVPPPTPTPSPTQAPTPAPISAAGSWNVALASGLGLGSGVMQLHEAGTAVVGTWGKVTIDGKMLNAEKLGASWKGPQGAGWLSLWLDSAQSLHGIWGWNGKPTSGRFVGHRVEQK